MSIIKYSPYSVTSLVVSMWSRELMRTLKKLSEPDDSSLPLSRLRSSIGIYLSARSFFSVLFLVKISLQTRIAFRKNRHPFILNTLLLLIYFF